MRYFINEFVRFLVMITLKGYFRKIIIDGIENIPKNKPILLVANHQNALIDPMLLGSHTNLKPYYLTRASVFKKSIVAKMLNYIQMLPVYRVRDGFSTIQNNQDTFDQTYEVLRDNGVVLIFAEGSHSLIRAIRPLSKGFTRMAFGLKEKYPETQPVVLPVAVDYSAHKKSGGTARITFGQAIPVDMPPSKSGLLTKSVEKAMKNLVVEIPLETYEHDLANLIKNNVDLTCRAEVKVFLETGEVPNPISETSGLKNKLMKIFHFPLYWLWLYKKPSVKDPVFSSTWKFMIGFTLLPLYYLFLLYLSINSPLGSWALAFLIMACITLLVNKNPQE